MDDSPRQSPVDAARQARIDLAAVYRLLASHGWGDVIFNRAAMRVPSNPRRFLIKRHELLYNEVTASNLAEVSMDDDLDERSGVNRPGFTLHSGVMRGRHSPDAWIKSCQTRGKVAATRQSTIGFQPVLRLPRRHREVVGRERRSRREHFRCVAPNRRNLALRSLFGRLSCRCRPPSELWLARRPRFVEAAARRQARGLFKSLDIAGFGRCR